MAADEPVAHAFDQCLSAETPWLEDSWWQTWERAPVHRGGGAAYQQLGLPIGLLVRSAVGMTDVKYLAKKELFTPWIGWMFRALGGYPVDRKKHTNMTEAVVDLFHHNPDFKIAITPEGTRKYVPEWKTGFHRIAILAHVPIILCSFDFGTKTVTFSDVFPLSGNVAEDIEAMKAIFRKAKGRNPDQGIL
ncbi:MAG: 1-acyl-sn-glycerol-3-phosphate acyltransferase [Flavobacteriales bacterium]|nr:1-acyl-sn-glycerol-3-phosphate acyltransferase [Flavobacteriales bacterium]